MLVVGSVIIRFVMGRNSCSELRSSLSEMAPEIVSDVHIRHADGYVYVSHQR